MPAVTSLGFSMLAIVVLNSIAQGLLKAGAGRGLINPALMGGVLAYGASTLLYVMVLGRANLSFVYPVVIGATMVVTCIGGVRVFGEVIGPVQWLGIALIVAGIACVALTRKTTI